MTQILQGIRVLEVAQWWFVPSAGAILSDWGAEVIKIEHPETGDPQRGLVTSGLVPEGGIEDLERVETWRGLRPRTPDDLPVIGRARALPGVVIATGHGMSGISQGPITGLLVAQLIAGGPSALDLAPFSPDRF